MPLTPKQLEAASPTMLVNTSGEMSMTPFSLAFLTNSMTSFVVCASRRGREHDAIPVIIQYNTLGNK